MGLYFKKTLNNGLRVVVWRLTESLEDLVKEVELEECYREAFEAISVPAKKREFLAGKFVLEKACAILNIDFKYFFNKNNFLRLNFRYLNSSYTVRIISISSAEKGSNTPSHLFLSGLIPISCCSSKYFMVLATNPS